MIVGKAKAAADALAVRPRKARRDELPWDRFIEVFSNADRMGLGENEQERASTFTACSDDA